MITGVTDDFNWDKAQPVTVISDAQLQIDDLIKKIRPDISNLRNGNGKWSTIRQRIESRFEEIENITGEHGREKLGAVIIDRVEAARRQYRQALKKEVAP